MSGDALIAEEENVNASERASYVPTWYAATMVPASARGPLTFDLDVDVCVVGAGGRWWCWKAAASPGARPAVTTVSFCPALPPPWIG